MAAPDQVVRICTTPSEAVCGTDADGADGRYRRLKARGHGEHPPVAYSTDSGWPHGQLSVDAPPAASAALYPARELHVAMMETQTGQRALTVATGVAHTTMTRLLAGTVLCDSGTFAKLDRPLGRSLWPRPSAGN